ncbi:hypothetical protein B0H63DRAFT_507253 [Podospora didyma]|uniref:Fungal N-terminal domain-containing protein n=1 Tax=Podospora didyma TaxID=330526 RepID=A0AAE0U3Q8_9PEZI|nr:hypothetical protein B0H63DRAFT_507253 [Podospora didyma]
MDPISLAASAVAFVGATARLAHGCFQLYEFWESVKGAPAEVNFIKNDLQLLANILKEIGDEDDLSNSVRLALDSCQAKLNVSQSINNMPDKFRYELLLIVQQLDATFLVTSSKRQRVWMAYRITTKEKRFQNFREGLRSLKETLMLGLMWQNLQRPTLCFTDSDVQKVQVTAKNTGDPRHQMQTPVLTKVDPRPTPPPQYEDPESELESPPPYSMSKNSAFTPPPAEKSMALTSKGGSAQSTDIIASSPKVQAFLQHSFHLAVESLFKSGTVEQLMSESVGRVTSFDSTCRGSYGAGEDGESVQLHTVDGLHDEDDDENSASSSSSSSSNSNPPQLKRARVCHQTSSMGVLLGSIWIRTSTLKVENEATASSGRAEVITSFIFYPSSWFSWLGFRAGAEANLQFSPSAGWRFHVTPVRAVPESALIFDFCRAGNVSAVKQMLARGDASVKDTSPKGWTPLHFAAAAGHVDLCAALIESGADKTALAYQGPSENALSPIAIWAESCQDARAADKIQMMRAFYECLDLAESSGEGWFVIHALVSSMTYEKVPMKDTGVNWFLRKAESGMLVGFAPITIWDGLQHSVRGSLFHEHEHLSLHHHLGLDATDPKFGIASQVTALSNLFAVASCSRKLLPLLIEAGIGVGVNGFDAVEEHMLGGRRRLIRGLPEIYVTWCKILPRSFETMSLLIEIELERLLLHIGMERDEFSERLSTNHPPPAVSKSRTGGCENESSYRCTGCNTSYDNIGIGLVQPRKISFEECRKKDHRRLPAGCQCAEYLRALGVTPLKTAQGGEDTSGLEEEEEADEEIFSDTAAEVDPVDQLCRAFDELYVRDQESSKKKDDDPFHVVIRTLFQAQGRRWLGGYYEPTEKLCGVCLLTREQYLASDGSAKGPRRYTPVPETFVASTNRTANSTF